MFKNFMILYAFYGFISLQASEKSSLRSFADNVTQYLSPKPSEYGALPTEDSSSRVFPLTPAEIEDRRRQQIAAVAAQPKKTEIGTQDALLSLVVQMFLNEPREYKGICLRSFYNNYPAQIDEFSVDALSFSSLDPDIVDLVYEKFTAIEEESRNLPESRDIRVSGTKLYSIVGVQPFKDEFREALFDVSLARKQVKKSAHTFIDSHYLQVREQCKPIPKIKSNKVLGAPCCGKQFHEPCLVSCRDYGVSYCPGRFCQRAENGEYYGKTWDAPFYQQMMQGKALDRNEIKNDTCSLCEDPLKRNLPNIPLRAARSSSRVGKKQKK